MIIGGGDTGADCLGTAIRQGAKSITQLEILPTPARRAAGAPALADVPDDLPGLLGARGGRRAGLLGVDLGVPSATRTATSASLTLSEVKFEGGKLTADRGHRAGDPGRAGAAGHGLRRSRDGTRSSPSSASTLDERGNIARDNNYATDVDGVFVCGDAGRGQSLIVWAIAEGRACAAGVDEYLSGSTKLPRPIPPTARQMMV